MKTLQREESVSKENIYKLMELYILYSRNIQDSVVWNKYNSY